MPKNSKHINFFILTCALILLSFSTNAQEVRVIDNKGTIQKVNNNRVFTQATDPNPSLPTPPITVQGDIWFNSSVTPNEMNVWNGTSWVTVSTQNNAWLRANSTDIPNDINDNIYTNGRIGINDDNPDYAIKVITQSEGIDRFLRFETNDSNDYLEISNTTSSPSTLSGGFIGGTLQTNRAALNFFGDTEISDDNASSEPIIKFFARRGSNNANITPNPYGGAAEAVTNRPLFDFLNGDTDSKLRILANGNTGIDVDTPTEKLDINGKLRIRDISTVTTNNDILTTDANGVVEKKKLVASETNNQISTGANGGVYLGPTVYTGAFIIDTNGNVTINTLPFQPSQITFVAHANVESFNLDLDNNIGDNNRGIANSFGTMNGFARNDSGTITQQVIYIGGSGNSINDISRFASSSNCIGLRYSDQNGNDLGKITASMTSFNTNGFTINVNRTNNASSENLVVLYTAYK